MNHSMRWLFCAVLLQVVFVSQENMAEEAQRIENEPSISTVNARFSAALQQNAFSLAGTLRAEQLRLEVAAYGIQSPNALTSRAFIEYCKSVESQRFANPERHRLFLSSLADFNRSVNADDPRDAIRLREPYSSELANLLGEHPLVARESAKLAEIFMRIRQFSKAEVYSNDAISIFRKSGWTDHPDCMGAALTHAVACVEQEKFAQGAADFQYVQGIAEKINSNDVDLRSKLLVYEYLKLEPFLSKKRHSELRDCCVDVAGANASAIVAIRSRYLQATLLCRERQFKKYRDSLRDLTRLIDSKGEAIHSEEVSIIALDVANRLAEVGELSLAHRLVKEQQQKAAMRPVLLARAKLAEFELCMGEGRYDVAIAQIWQSRQIHLEQESELAEEIGLIEMRIAQLCFDLGAYSNASEYARKSVSRLESVYPLAHSTISLAKILQFRIANEMQDKNLLPDLSRCVEKLTQAHSINNTRSAKVLLAWTNVLVGAGRKREATECLSRIREFLEDSGISHLEELRSLENCQLSCSQSLQDCQKSLGSYEWIGESETIGFFETSLLAAPLLARKKKLNELEAMSAQVRKSAAKNDIPSVRRISLQIDSELLRLLGKNVELKNTLDELEQLRSDNRRMINDFFLKTH